MIVFWQQNMTFMYLVCYKYIFFFRNFFNWTWTYKSDSDFVDTYGYFIEKSKEEQKSSWIETSNFNMYVCLLLNIRYFSIAVNIFQNIKDKIGVLGCFSL